MSLEIFQKISGISLVARKFIYVYFCTVRSIVS